MDIVSQNPNISRQISMPAKGNDNLVVQENNRPQNYATPFNSFNKYLVNFKGLNRTIGKTVYERAELIKKEVEKFPKSMGVVGNLPSEWIEKIPKTDRKRVILKLYKDFKTIIKDFRKDNDTKKATQNLNKALHEAGVIEKHEKLTVEKLGSGVYGTGFHLKGISGEKYMIKVFRSKDFLGNCNGNYAELNRAAYWQKNAGKNTQMVRFYFGDIEAGYMVNKYIDEKTPQCKKYVDPEIYGLISGDVAKKEAVSGDNKIKGFQIDYGGIDVFYPISCQR